MLRRLMQTDSAPKYANAARSSEASGSRLGFSLVEVLIALALTVLLLSAVYAAIGLHLRYQSAGRSQNARAQLYRGLIRKMDQDFTTIVLHQDQSSNAADSSGMENLVDPTLVDDTSLVIGGLDSANAPITFGLVGNEEILHLSVSRPSREMAYQSPYETGGFPGRSSDLLVVSYGLGPVDITRLIDPTQPRYSDTSKSLFEGRPLTALARRSIDLYAFNPADEELEEHDVIAPEVTDVSFAYFDGVAWLPTWDSRQIGALPRAVRVTYGLWQAPRNVRRTASNYLSAGVTLYIEHTFHIPLSYPLVY